MKKILSVLTSAVLLSGIAASMPMSYTTTNYSIEATAASESTYNYAEALQKSLFFYQVQQAGELPEWNEVSWRDDSMLTDIVQGGWFDAGDHFKFTLTNAFAAYNLAWGLIEYGDAVKEAGLYDHYLRNVKWGIDYVLACDLGDEVIGTIGHPTMDHVWWGSAELYERKMALQYNTDVRPYDTIKTTTTMADMSSALSTGYILLKDSDPDTANEYLEHAISLFERADEVRNNDEQGVQKTYYNTEQTGNDCDWADELLMAANWLYRATGDQSYLDKCENEYIDLLGRENQSTDFKYTWGYCWDDVMQAAILLYAQNTGEQEWIDHVERHLNYWMGEDSKAFTYTPDGLAWLTNWGANRHAANTSWLALLAADTIFADDAALSTKYNEWAKGQLHYMFGDNNLGLCYVMGMGDKNPVNIHHRTTAGSWDDHWNDLGKLNEDGTPYQDPKWQTEYAHICYGALIGGPSQDGSFRDENAAYEHTEVTIDYNAGFTAALCAMIDDYGGEKLEDFPVEEEPKWDEFFMKASFNQTAASYTEIKAYAMNHSAWPARVIQDLSYNYYFDITELVEQGFSINDVVVTKGTDQHSGDEGVATVSEPIHYDGNIYYVKITFGDGRVVMPTGQSEHRSELQFRIGIPDSLKTADGTKATWDYSNDYSATGLVQGGEDAMIKTANMTMYDGDTLIWGVEPDGTSPSPEPDILYGDINLDGVVDAIDGTMASRYAVGRLTLEEQQLLNGDVNCDGTLDAIDATIIIRYSVGMIKVLPV